MLFFNGATLSKISRAKGKHWKGDRCSLVGFTQREFHSDAETPAVLIAMGHYRLLGSVPRTVKALTREEKVR
ncbi:hypothetical protein FKM82_008198 [Ascaphus truei]